MKRMLQLPKLVIDVRALNLFDEFLYLLDLFFGVFFRNFCKLKNVYQGRFYIKELFVIVKSRLNSLYFVPPRGNAVHSILPVHEEMEFLFLKNILKRGDVFVDVGAHLGCYTIPAAKIVGKEGLVIAIEPSPISTYLIKSILANSLSNVIVIKKPIYSSKSKLWFVYFKEKSGASHLSINRAERSLAVSTETLDDIYRKYVRKKIKCLKIDVEGFELEALKGAKKMLKNVMYIIIEVKKENRRKVIDFLRKEGFITLMETGENEKNIIFRKKG